MATHGLHGIGREAFGSVTVGVVAQSPCPVRVSRPHVVPEPILA
jgi:nucleotide-binding universal stress UspA family protein